MNVNFKELLINIDSLKSELMFLATQMEIDDTYDTADIEEVEYAIVNAQTTKDLITYLTKWKY